MFTLPVLDLEEIPMRLDPLGRVQFCGANEEAMLVSFGVVIIASSTDDWQIEGIHVGTQALSPHTELFRRIARHLEAEHTSTFHDHIVDHLPDAKDDAAYERQQFHMGT
jgi:hypothetical protein